MDKEIAKFDKNAREEIRIKLTNFKGHDLIDIRSWIKPISSKEEPQPTKKGITIKVEQITELVNALNDAEKEYKKAIE